MGRPARQPGAAVAVTRDVAIGVAGRIGSGKTTLAAELACQLACPQASFGEFVRSVAETRALVSTTDRTVLQDLGDELIAQGGLHSWRRSFATPNTRQVRSSSTAFVTAQRSRLCDHCLNRPRLSLWQWTSVTSNGGSGCGSEDSSPTTSTRHIYANESEVDPRDRATDFVVLGPPDGG